MNYIYIYISFDILETILLVIRIHLSYSPRLTYLFLYNLLLNWQGFSDPIMKIMSKYATIPDLIPFVVKSLEALQNVFISHNFFIQHFFVPYQTMNHMFYLESK